MFRLLFNIVHLIFNSFWHMYSFYFVSEFHSTISALECDYHSAGTLNTDLIAICEILQSSAAHAVVFSPVVQLQLLMRSDISFLA